MKIRRRIALLLLALALALAALALGGCMCTQQAEDCAACFAVTVTSGGRFGGASIDPCERCMAPVCPSPDPLPDPCSDGSAVSDGGTGD